MLGVTNPIFLSGGGASSCLRSSPPEHISPWAPLGVVVGYLIVNGSIKTDQTCGWGALRFLN